MPFGDRSAVEAQKLEFARLASMEGANVSALCRQFGIGRTCGHKLIARYLSEGEAGLVERSRRPRARARAKGSPRRWRRRCFSIRAEHPSWGGRKIARVVARTEHGHPAASTVTAIMQRNGMTLGAMGVGAKPFSASSASAPNELWQMDFKGQLRHAATAALSSAHRARRSLALCVGARAPAPIEQDETVPAMPGGDLPPLRPAFRPCSWTTARHGAIRAANAIRCSPSGCCAWGSASAMAGPIIRRPRARTNASIARSRPRCCSGRSFADLAQCQHAFDRWRPIYNTERPHEALDLAVPADRYRISPRQYREAVEPLRTMPRTILVRHVQQTGVVCRLRDTPFRARRSALPGRSSRSGQPQPMASSMPSFDTKNRNNRPQCS